MGLVTVASPGKAVSSRSPDVVMNTRAGVTGLSVPGTPLSKVQVTVVLPFEEIPLPVTPSMLQSMLSEAISKVTENSRVVSSMTVIAVTVGEEASRASNLQSEGVPEFKQS